MKFNLIVNRPTTVSMTLRIGTVIKQEDDCFLPFIGELSKLTIISNDSAFDGGWKDFFHHKQNNGINGYPVVEIEVLNINNGSSRITFKLTYTPTASVIVIAKSLD